METASVLSNCSPSSSLTQRSHSDSRGMSNGARCYCFCSVKLNGTAFSRGLSVGRLRKRCTVMRWGGEQDNDSGEERPETLFMRELAKRKELGQDVGTDTKTKEEEKTEKPLQQQPVSTDDQRKRSMALNSEGLEGLVPRGQELVKLGGSFWLSLWPLIAASLLAFAAAYLYFGPAFVHSGSRANPPPYVDPYQLLESEQLPYQVGPNRVPYNTYRSPQ